MLELTISLINFLKIPPLHVQDMLVCLPEGITISAQMRTGEQVILFTGLEALVSCWLEGRSVTPFRDLFAHRTIPVYSEKDFIKLLCLPHKLPTS